MGRAAQRGGKPKVKEVIFRLLWLIGVGLFSVAALMAAYLALNITPDDLPSLMMKLGAGGLVLIGTADRFLAKGKISHLVWYPPNRYFFGPINRQIPLRIRNRPKTRFWFYVFSGFVHFAAAFLLGQALAASLLVSALMSGIFLPVFVWIGVKAEALAREQERRLANGEKLLRDYL